MTICIYLSILFSMYQISSSYIQIFLIIWICHLTFLFCVLFWFYNILWSSIVCYCHLHLFTHLLIYFLILWECSLALFQSSLSILNCSWLLNYCLSKQYSFHKWATHWLWYLNLIVTNFIQLVSPQPVDQFPQNKLYWKAPNVGYLHICGRYKSEYKWLRYQAISSCKSFVC